MKYSLGCPMDNFVAKGSSRSEVMNRLAKHAKKYHDMSDKEIAAMKREMRRDIIKT